MSPNPDQTAGAGDKPWTPFSTMEPEPGGKRDLAIKRVEAAKNVQQKDVPDQMAMVRRSDLIDLFHQLWWTQGVAKHLKAEAERAPTPLPVGEDLRERAAAYLLSRDEALGPYDATAKGDAERLQSASDILALVSQDQWRPLAERARDSLKWALAPFRPLHTKAEADQVLADLEAILALPAPKS